MMFLVAWILKTVQEAVLDIIVYLVIDGFVKVYLQDTNDEGEKQQVWLWECITLSVFSLLIYSVSHTPWILLIILTLTIVYTQLQNPTNFPQLPAQILNKWKEFQLHERYEQSMVKIHAASTAHAQMLQQAQLLQSHNINSGLPDTYSPDGAGQMPIHPMMASYITTRPLLVQPSIKQTSSIKARIISSLGYNPYSEHPPGLENPGQLCFMNAVLQCLARAPGVALCLLQPNLSVASQSQTLVDDLGKLLEKLSLPPGQLEERFLKTRQLRTGLSSLVNSPIAAERERQSQQDAGEFLLWLINGMHDIIKQPVNQDVTGELALPRQLTSPVQATLTLDIINLMYERPDIERLKELKENTLTEIESGHKMKRCYFGSMKRLANLEWLLYKHSNNSAIDDLFCGQLLEAWQCSSCERIKVNIQPFKILNMCLCQPRTVDGLVYLFDCFTHLMALEVLNGENGIKCDCLNLRAAADSSFLHKPVQSKSISPMTANGFTPSTPNNQLRHRYLNSSASNMSPVVSMEGGSANRLLDTDSLKNSTPVPNCDSRALWLTEGHRKTLLHQLPECLTIHLIRFTILDGCATKTKQPLAFPSSNLDLTELVNDKELWGDSLSSIKTNFRYTLYAFCVHIGSNSTSSGHYIAYAHVGSGAWYRFDDDKVIPVNIEYTLSTREVRENAYLLFYRKFNG